jgi:ribosome-binding protein aMBF1 (putative translation factor)
MDQDWTPVVLRKDKPVAKPVQYVNKTSVGGKISVDDDGTETVKIKKISYNTSQFIIKTRTEKNMKQTDLAKLCNLDKQIIANIERGDCVYNPQHVNKIGRVLGVKIPRE